MQSKMKPQITFMDEKISINGRLIERDQYQTNIIVWSIIFVYPLFGILDFVFANNIYVALLFVKAVSLFVVYVCNDIFSKSKRSKLAIHVSFIIISINAGVVCSFVNPEVLPIFFAAYSGLLIFFNAIVVWPARNSFFHLLFSNVFMYLMFNFADFRGSMVHLVEGQLFFTVLGFLSCLIPYFRRTNETKPAVQENYQQSLHFEQLAESINQTISKDDKRRTLTKVSNL